MASKLTIVISDTSSSQQESPDCSNEQKMLMKNKYTYWSERENKIYVEYIRSNKELMAECKDKKRQRVFLHMSKLIKTRTPKQVKSHHQKLIKQHLSVDSIVQHFDQLLPIPTQSSLFQKAVDETLSNKAD
jgi:hypothetical protein